MQVNSSGKENYGPPFVDNLHTSSMSVGKRIRMLRKEKDWKLKDLARESKVPVSTISDLEHGRSMNSVGDTLVKIAAALGTSSDWLQTGEGVPVRKAEPHRIDESELLRIYGELLPANQEALLATAKALRGSQNGPNPRKSAPPRPRPPDLQ
jgi:transcriptional regulator with XRE-family HTH domain